MIATALLVRSYTPKFEEVEDRASRALKVAQDAHKLFIGDVPAFQMVLFVVPSDYDCGNTGAAIRGKLAGAGLDRTLTIEVAGHHSCEALNEAVHDLHGRGIVRVFIVSGKAASYVTTQVFDAVSTAFSEGAKVVGVAVDELADIVCEGLPQNTFCAWDVLALIGEGIFDSKGGVEEVAPTARLIKRYGPCVAVLMTVGGKLNILQSETARARHDEVVKTKGPRQRAEAERAGVDMEFFKSGIMPGYPRPI